MNLNKIAIVFAAGKGSRLQPLTLKSPKPLLKVMGKSLLEWNMDKVADLVDKFVIVISYLGDQIVREIGASFKGKPVEYVWQKNPKGGTLDALRTALFYSEFKLSGVDFLVLNADDIHGQEIYRHFEKHMQLNPEIMALSARLVQDKERLKSLGVFEVDEQNNLIKIWEKPQQFISNLANSGIYYLPAKVVSFVTPELNQSEIEHYITTDLFGVYLKQKPIQILSSTDMWLQISTVQDLEDANKFMEELEE